MLETSFLQRLIASGRYESEADVNAQHELLIADLRKYLKSADYPIALAALDLVIEKKNGALRKDGETPSVLHEISQALYTISMIEDGVHLNDPESVIALNLIHDLGEDFGLKPGELIEYLEEKIPNKKEKGQTELNQFFQKIKNLAHDFDLITKQYLGENPKFENEYEYYRPLQESQNASIAKLLDRLHNMATVIGVMKDKKAMYYICDTMVIANDYVKHASKKFPEQSQAYQMCHEMIKTVCQVNRYHLSRNVVGKRLPDMAELEQEMPDKGFHVPSGLNPIFMTAERVMKHGDWDEPRVQAITFDLGRILQNAARVLNIAP